MKPHIYNNNYESYSKQILIITGVHGDEITPLMTGIELINSKKISNYNIKIINGVNIESLRVL